MLKGKTAVATGSTSGMGLGTTLGVSNGPIFCSMA
jgi:NAD(P)-dependent dehydrogenase (short-subunit alcohol dehydrogenase family)